MPGEGEQARKDALGTGGVVGPEGSAVDLVTEMDVVAGKGAGGAVGVSDEDGDGATGVEHGKERPLCPPKVVGAVGTGRCSVGTENGNDAGAHATDFVGIAQGGEMEGGVGAAECAAVAQVVLENEGRASGHYACVEPVDVLSNPPVGDAAGIVDVEPDGTGTLPHHFKSCDEEGGHGGRGVAAAGVFNPFAEMVGVDHSVGFVFWRTKLG